MTKLNFLLSLRNKLSALPQAAVEERLTFYSEIIEDRMEEGFSEEEAVAAVGSMEEIAAQIIQEIAPAKTIQAKPQLTGWEIALLVLGAPLWVPLLIAAFAVILSLYAALWSIIVSLWAAFGSVTGCALGGIVGGIGFALGDSGLAGVAMLGAGIVCAGLSVFLFVACKSATKGAWQLSKIPVSGIRNRFSKRRMHND